MRFVIPVVLILLQSGCVTNPKSDSDFLKISLKGSFAQAGLSGTAVNGFSRLEDDIYAVADGGLYQIKPGENENRWGLLGLPGENVVDLVFLPGGRLLAAIRYIYVNQGKSTLFLSTDDGLSWQDWTSNFGGQNEKNTFVAALTTPKKPSDTIFAHIADRTVAKSVDGGEHWRIVAGNRDNFGGSVNSIYINASHPETVWAVGATPFIEPYILKSENGGNTWEALPNILENEDAVCYDVITSQKNNSIALAGLGSGFLQSGLIRKSADGGQHWKTVFEGMNTYALEQSIQNTEVAYASGQNEQGTLFFAVSSDFGDTWETVEFEDGPARIRVNDMLSVLQNGKEMLYFATNQGVYSYTFEE